VERSPEDWLRAALPAYGLDGCPFTLLQTFGDVVARVETLAGPRSLRVNLPGSGERQEEIQRFLTLAHAAGLTVPGPLTDLQRRLVSPLPEGRTAVLASWLEGQQASRQMSPALAAEVARVTAALHAVQFAPALWHGPKLDADWLRGWWSEQAPAHLSSADVARCLPAVETAAAWLEVHAHELRVIHADLHFGNLLALGEGKIGVLDFGDCALGHPAFDLAMTEGEFMDFTEGPALIAAYRDAYSAASGREFPLRARAVMGACTATSFLEWVHGSANEQVREKKLKWIPALLDRMSGLGE
jgi:Ser/Thr protein kinase RdoA (MazF antagonist)